MEENRPLSVLNYTTETAHLAKTLLDRRRLALQQERDTSAHTEGTSVNISWAACKDFTVDVGKHQIGQYIKTWEVQPCWIYSLDFLYTTEEDCHTFYLYRARFSTPSPQKPIQGTASVYFVVDVSKVKPQAAPVEVRFVLEASRLVHTPGRTRFRESWLVDIIESKTLLGRAVDL
ncbi:A-kinase anchor protein 14 [Mastacembelus armatus]|uniref:Si:dkeyp-81f3.4 n=1 Tax=Mastacembelus armatus TaxID=205130 RepID=A0A3Q3LHV6_9TELE|nr:A-kinase anchor protein 14 [Mastacembelus armatus]